MLIRPAAAEDAEEILAIYAPYVRNTAVTFEYDVIRFLHSKQNWNAIWGHGFSLG